jgi:hypothetical protein
MKRRDPLVKRDGTYLNRIKSLEHYCFEGLDVKKLISAARIFVQSVVVKVLKLVILSLTMKPEG